MESPDQLPRLAFRSASTDYDSEKCIWSIDHMGYFGIAYVAYESDVKVGPMVPVV